MSACIPTMNENVTLPLPPDIVPGGRDVGIYRLLLKACRSLVAIRVFVRS